MYLVLSRHSSPITLFLPEAWGPRIDHEIVTPRPRQQNRSENAAPQSFLVAIAVGGSETYDTGEMRGLDVWHGPIRRRSLRRAGSGETPAPVVAPILVNYPTSERRLLCRE